jgi:hypothetical protein
LGGKFSHALVAVATPRLAAAYDLYSMPNAAYKKAQVGFNDVAGTLAGRRRIDHIPVVALLKEAGVKSVNSMVVRAVAMEAWNAFHSSDGKNGARIPIGGIIFDGNEGGLNTRAEMAGNVQIGLRGVNTFATHSARVWNASSALRTAETSAAARQGAIDLARSAPL